MRRVDTFLLASIGVLITHQFAYSITPYIASTATVDHSHLTAAWTLSSLAMLVGLARAIVVSVKRRRHADLHISRLAGAIGLGFLALEQAERLAAGYSPTALFGELVFWVGLAVIPVVATVLSRSIRTITEFAAKWAPSTRQWPTARIAQPALPVLVPVHVAHRGAVSRRGPPVR